MPQKTCQQSTVKEKIEHKINLHRSDFHTFGVHRFGRAEELIFVTLGRLHRRHHHPYSSKRPSKASS